MFHKCCSYKKDMIQKRNNIWKKKQIKWNKQLNDCKNLRSFSKKLYFKHMILKQI